MRISAVILLLIPACWQALLGHGAKSPTRDIDTFEGNPLLLKEAMLRAQAEIGFTVPIGAAPVADLPMHYEDRD